MSNMYTDIMEYCVEHAIPLTEEQIESAKQTFSEDGGVEDAAQKVIAAASGRPRTDDESQVDYDINAGQYDDAAAGGVDPEDILAAIGHEADGTHRFSNDEDDLAKTNEAAMDDTEFYGLLYDFMNENGVPIPDSAMETFQEAGIFDNSDSYTDLLEFCVSNGVSMDQDQLAEFERRFG